jgi:energy-coupling factor transport system ATP-binding protein
VRIEWRDLSVSLDGPDAVVLREVDLVVEEAELLLVAGRTGAGKSTLLRTVNGLVPEFSGGLVRGEVLLDGEPVRGRAPRELAHLVGYVGQDPAATFVADTVEEELAYGMEQLGLDPQTMRRRVEETLDLLGIAELRHRGLRALSGGQQQRVALGAVLTMHPRALVLDEPTSALDPTAAEDVLSTVKRLVDDLGLTVLLAEHRLERVLPFADRVAVVEDGRVRAGPTSQMLRHAPVAPPLVELGRVAGWDPLPLSVREARRRTPALVARLGDPPRVAARERGPTLLAARGVAVRYAATVAVREVSLDVARGEVVALMGRNGSGKSSLLWALQGSGRRDGGTVEVEGVDPARAGHDRARRLVGLVPQTAADLLYLETVAEECAAADSEAGAGPGRCRRLLDRLAPGVPDERHPRDLSEGQRLALVLAVVLTAEPPVVALDEPTRGLDYAGKHQLASVVGGLAGAGHAVLVASHDVEFVAQVADRVVVLAGGEVVSTGPAARVLAESPAFAPQLSKTLGPGWLTVDQVREALR